MKNLIPILYRHQPNDLYSIKKYRHAGMPLTFRMKSVLGSSLGALGSLSRRRPISSGIIMEDAEKILFQRRSDNNESVSALLNIADGLMGQMLRVHVLCTLNHGMDQLDPASLA